MITGKNFSKIVFTSFIMLAASSARAEIAAAGKVSSDIEVSGACITSLDNGSAETKISLSSKDNSSIMLNSFSRDQAGYQVSIVKINAVSPDSAIYYLTLARIQDDFMAEAGKVRGIDGRTSTRAFIQKDLQTGKLTTLSSNYFKIGKKFDAGWDGERKTAEGNDFTMSLNYKVKAGKSSKSQEITVLCPISVK